jgi:protein NrfD
VPDTFYTTPPEWTWWIIFYFFIGGIAGGCAFIAAMLYFIGRPADRGIVRAGYYVALVGAVISGILLILDLHRPLRFWHMLIQSETLVPIFKYWTPMSVGSWGLTFFGAFVTAAAWSAAKEAGDIRWGPGFLLAHWFRGLMAALSAFFGLFLAGYTGVLLSVSNRPVWADSPLLGMLFLFSAGSTAAATLILLARRRNLGDAASLGRLKEFDSWALALELMALLVFLGTLGAAFQVFVSFWGVLLVLGVIGAGILVPLAISMGWVKRWTTTPATTAVLVLVGGFLLRVVTLLSSEDVHLAGSRVIVP